jgi:hypothetical protein
VTAIKEPIMRNLSSFSPARRIPASALALLVALASSWHPAAAVTARPTPTPAPSAYDRVLIDYETIRLALVVDSLDGIPAAAGRIQAAVTALGSSPDATAAGVPREALPQLTALLPEVQKAAAATAGAKDLVAARQGFHQLTGALLRWRQASGRGPAVAYCPMVHKQWLQSGEQPIGNPYLGKKMPTCGELTR